MAAQAPEVRVHVTTATDASGFTDLLQERRREAVALLSRSADGKKNAVVVEYPALADIRLTGGQRRAKGRRQSERGALGLRTRTSQKSSRKRMHLRSKSRLQVELEAGGGAQLAARDIAEAVEKWIKDNRAHLTGAAR